MEEFDDLPHNLCSTCLQEVIRIHLFRQKCEQNENLLRLLLKEQKLLKREADDSFSQDFEYKSPTSHHDSNTRTNAQRPCKKIKDSNNRTLFCRDCSKEFTSTADLKEHKKTVKHPEIRSHTCSVCSKMFTSSKLRQHMRAHTKEKPYVCSVCSQAFSISGNLKRHMMTHTGERPHVCEFCGKGELKK